MRALTSTELERMQDTQAVALPNTCLIQVATTGQDSIGSPARTWGTRATGVACRLKMKSAGERTFGTRNVPVGDWMLTLDHGQAIVTADRVIVSGRTFEVVAVNEGDSWETATRADLVEVV